MRILISMSVVQACAETEAAIQRARALFASEPEPAAGAANAAGAVQNAAQSTTAAGQTTTDMSGGFIDAHTMFVDESAPKLSVPPKPTPPYRHTPPQLRP